MRSVDRESSRISAAVTAYTVLPRKMRYSSQPASQRLSAYSATLRYHAAWNVSHPVIRLRPAMTSGYSGGHSTNGLPSMSTNPLPASRLSAVERLRAASDETPAPYFDVVSKMRMSPAAARTSRKILYFASRESCSNTEDYYNG